MNLAPCRRCGDAPQTTVEGMFVYVFCERVSCLFFGRITIGSSPGEAYAKWNGMQDNLLTFPVPGRPGSPVQPQPDPLPDPPRPAGAAR